MTTSMRAAGTFVAILAAAVAGIPAAGAAAAKPRPPVIAWVVSLHRTLTEVNTLTGRVVRTLILPCRGGTVDVSMTPQSPVGYVYGCVQAGMAHIVPVNTRAGTAGAPIPIGRLAPGQGSIHHAQVFTPDGKVLYVGVADGMRPVDTATGEIGPLIATPQPGMAVMAPDGSALYVETWITGTVTPIETATNTALQPIHVGVIPDALAITPDGKTLYVGSEGTPEVIPVSTATGAVCQPIHVGGLPVDMVMAPGGKTVYVATAAPGTVTPIRTATNQAEPPIRISGVAAQLAITPDGRTLYVVRLDVQAGSRSGAIVPVRTATGRALAAIPIDRGVWSGSLRIEMGPEGFELYALVPRAIGKGELIPVSTATNKKGRPVPVPGPLWAGFSQS